MKKVLILHEKDIGKIIAKKYGVCEEAVELHIGREERGYEMHTYFVDTLEVRITLPEPEE